MLDEIGRQIARLSLGIFLGATLLNVAILASGPGPGPQDALFVFGGFFGVVGFLYAPGSTALRLAAAPGRARHPALPRRRPFDPARSLADRPISLIARYAGRRGNRTVELRLYRRGVFTIRQAIDRPPGEAGTVELSRVGDWEERGEGRLALRLGEETARFEPSAIGDPSKIRQVAGFPSFESDPELSLDGLDLAREPPPDHRP